MSDFAYVPVRYAVLGADRVFIEARDFDRDGVPTKWCVIMWREVLNHGGEWEWDLSPSSRTDEFIARTRYATQQDAFDALAKAVRANRESSPAAISTEDKPRHPPFQIGNAYCKCGHMQDRHRTNGECTSMRGDHDCGCTLFEQSEDKPR